MSWALKARLSTRKFIKPMIELVKAYFFFWGEDKKKVAGE